MIFKEPASLEEKEAGINLDIINF